MFTYKYLYVLEIHQLDNGDGGIKSMKLRNVTALLFAY